MRGGGKDLGYLYVVLQGEEHDRLAAQVSASSVLRTTLWAMSLVALLGLIAGLIAFRLITRPLRRLTETMRDFDTDAAPAQLPVLSEPGPGVAMRSRCWKPVRADGHAHR